MKLLYLPLIYGGVNNEQKYLSRAFSSEFETRSYDYYNFQGKKDDELMRIVQTFKPDVIHGQFHGTSYIQPFSLAHIKLVYPHTVITQWIGDVRPEPTKEVIEYGKYCDITFVVSQTDVEQYKAAGVKDVQYWQNAVSQEQIGHPARSPKGIVFCGGGHYGHPLTPQRRELVQAFKDTFKEFKLYGPGWSEETPTLQWDRQTEIYEQCYLSVGHNQVDGKKHWFSDRSIIAMAAGRPHLFHYSEGMEELFEDMKEVVFWKTIPEAIEKAQWLLDNHKEATKIGKMGQKKIKEKYMWGNRVLEYKEAVSKY